MGAPTAAPPVSTVVDIIRTRGTDPTHAGDAAIEFEGATYSYGDLDALSNRLAAALVTHGVGAGDRVAYIDKNRADYFVVLFGAAKVGAVCVAVSFRLAAREVAHIVRDSTAKVLFVGGGFHDVIEQVEDDISATEMVTLDVHSRWPSLNDWLSPADTPDPGHPSGPDDVALQLYTSGTTGLPKGAMLANRNLFGMADVAGAAWHFRPHMVSLGVSPLFHIAGTGWTLMVLAYGGTVVLHRDVDPGAILRDIDRCGVTHGLLVPAILQLILDRRQNGDPVDASSLELVVYGASPISDDVLLGLFDAFDCDFVQGYGLTETAGAVTILPAEDHDRSRPQLLRSCGRALPGVGLRIVDPETGAECAEGSVGEVLIRAASVMVGYWNQPAATAEAIDADGWFHSGDAGFLRDGRLYLHDRIKDMIVSGAENVYPAEVENVLMRHPSIVDVAVIGIPHDRWGETVKAVIVTAAGATVSADEVIAFARADLAHYKCPSSIDFVDELPRNAAGKILKRVLREPYWVGRDRRISG
ncbi:MAG TPA: long-chain-fatty-acid--CoA ligase [Ilumatobacter sp.]|nr:long-chain-fatty-acid--CoA ligase [Ilumatobacter sp.]